MKKRILISRIFLVLAVVCLVITIISLIPTGKSEWGGLPWLLAKVFLILGLASLLDWN